MTFKKINPKETVFYVFETSTIKFSIFDSEMDEAIYWGNWNMVISIIKNIKKQNPNVKFYYYSKDNKEKMVLAQDWTNTLNRITGV